MQRGLKAMKAIEHSFAHSPCIIVLTGVDSESEEAQKAAKNEGVGELHDDKKYAKDKTRRVDSRRNSNIGR